MGTVALMMASSPSVSGFLAAEKDLATLGVAILLRANIFTCLYGKKYLLDYFLKIWRMCRQLLQPAA
jgi:hypothetical protein